MIDVFVPPPQSDPMPIRPSTRHAPSSALPGAGRTAAHRAGPLPWASALLLMLGMAACGGGGHTAGAAPAPSRQPADSGTHHPSALVPLPGNIPAGSPSPAAPGTGPAGSTAAGAPHPGNHGPANPTPPSPQADICQPLLAQQPRLLAGQDNSPLPTRPRPATGVAQADPTYHSCVVRLTANDGGRNNTFLRHDYARRQAFNADSSRLLLYALDGYWHLVDARTLRALKRLAGPAGDAEPQWHPTDPNTLFYLNTNGLGMQIHRLDVASNTSTLVADMGAQVRRRWPEADTAWTRSEGSPSADGRYWCFQAERSRDWQTLGVFTWDMQTGQIIGGLDVQERPDHVSMSPSGQYCVVSSDGPMGTRAYTRDFTSPYFPGQGSQPWLQLLGKSEHSDIALDAAREDTFVAVDYGSGMVTMTHLPSGQKTPLFSVYPGRTATALHFSGKAYRKPGWVLVSTYAEHDPDHPARSLRNGPQQQWLHRKLFAVSLTASPQIRPIAHVDSTLHDRDSPGHANDLDPYWGEPQASVNPDFSRMLFNSTWNGERNLDTEAFLVAVPNDALDAPADSASSRPASRPVRPFQPPSHRQGSTSGVPLPLP